MSNQQQDQLAQSCTELADLSGAAQAWVEDSENADLVGAEARSLVQMMRRAGRRARRLARAARTRMSVSVFGPSQAGKSFLVSVLARPADGPLVVNFDAPDHGTGGALDYIREVNPEGEGESTGLVTRFTMERPATPPGFPIKLTLLSEADIIRTIVNSFFMDGDRSEPAPEAAEIAAHLDAFKSRAAGPQPGMDADEVYEIGEYIEASFGREAYAVALRPFWQDAAEIAPRLASSDRAAFFALLWGNHAPFSDLYTRMAQALGQLDHASEVYSGLDALIPRETSIIDVKTLGGTGGETPLTLSTMNGRQASLPRSVICALAAELVLPMQSLPSQMFNKTDLLDFPGARNRFEQDLGKAFEDAEAILPELLLRGKVAYLFDRYVQNQEITSMLLCVPDSNMETVDLPGLVQNWIATTHGGSAQARDASDCVLFMVLTKFDKHLGDSAAEGGDETRFERRMQASLLEKFGKGSDPWVTRWNSTRAFNNCFWLRNPNFYVDGLIDYDGDKRERGIRPEKAARVAELKAGCLLAPSVQRHFGDPQAAWDAALALNDGGVSYLMAELEKVCKPDSKLRQITSQLDQLSAALRRAIAPYHVSDDVETRMTEAEESVNAVIDDMEETLRRHHFGALMAALMVDQDEIEGRISRIPSSIRITSAVTSASSAATSGSVASSESGSNGGGLQRPGRPARPGRSARARDTVTQSCETDVRTMTLEQFQAETALEIWIDRLKAFRDNSPLRARFGVGDTTASDLVAELIHAARRTGLGQRTAAQLKAVNFGLTVEKQALPAAILGAESINSFVTDLGMRALPEGERPQVEAADGTTRAIFAPRRASNTIDDLPAQPRAMAEAAWTDWVFAIDAMFTANAKDGESGEINIDQNLALGRILSALPGDLSA